MVRQRVAAVLIIAWGLWLAGCGRNPARPAAEGASDRAAISRAIAASPELAMDFTDDAGELLGTADPATHSSQAGPLPAPADTGITATAPIHWGRRRIPDDRPPQRIVEFVLPPDSGRAIVRLTVRYDGWFYVDRTDDNLRNPGKKPLRDQATRIAIFRKIWFHPDSSATDSVFGWRLVGVSPVRFTMIDPARQTVEIHSVTVTAPEGTTTITDPGALLAVRTGTPQIPTVRLGETVTVTASVTNTDHSYRPSEYVYLHVPSNARLYPGPFDQARILMHDDGTGGDATAGDGVYTAQWKVQDVGRHHVTVDVLNARTLQTESGDDYNSTAWGIPYGSYPAL